MFVIAAVGLFLLGVLVQGLTLNQQVFLTVLSVLVLGMPHGALDVLMLKKIVNKLHLSIGFSRLQTTALLYSIYGVISVLAFITWLQWPAWVLLLFLIISSVHFAYDWQEFEHTWLIYALGTIVVTLPTLRYSNDVAAFFELLNLSSEQAYQVVSFMRIALFVSISCALITFLRTEQKKSFFISVLALFIAGLVLPPLMYFIAYFCALHAVMHTLSVKQNCGVGWHALIHALWVPMSGTLLLLALAYFFTPATNDIARWLHVVFIGLFALTVPHMILSFLCERLKASRL